MTLVKGMPMHKSAAKIPMILAILGAIWVLYAHSPFGNFADSWWLVAWVMIAAIMVPALLLIDSGGDSTYAVIVLFVLMVMAGGLSLVSLALKPMTSGAAEAELLSDITLVFRIGFFTGFLSVVMSLLLLMRVTKEDKRDGATA